MADDEQNLETFFQNAVVEISSNSQSESGPSPDLIGKLEAAKSAALNDTPGDEIANIIGNLIDDIKKELGVDRASSPASTMSLRSD